MIPSDDRARAQSDRARAHRAGCSAAARCRPVPAARTASSPPRSSASAAIRPCRRCWPRRCAAFRPSSTSRTRVMGRANRLLAPRVTRDRDRLSPACSMREPALAAKATRTGNPVRPAVIAAAATPYRGAGRRRAAAPARVRRQPGRADHGRRRAAGDRAARRRAARAPARSCSRRATRTSRAVRETYARLGVAAEVAPFFADLPARIAAAHLVVARSGASTVAELAAIGRPAILVPLPHALDQDQTANAGVLARGRRRDRLIQQASSRPSGSPREIAALAGRRRRSSPPWPRPPARRRARRRRAARRSGRCRSPASQATQETHGMKLPRDIGPIHFVGIGGIGMSGIAEVLLNLGYTVQGSDVADSANVKRLRDKGIDGRDRPRRRQSRRRRGRRRLDRDQARQSRAGRGARASGCRWCGAPRCWPS